MVLAADVLMGESFHGLRSYTDGVHIAEEKTKGTEKTEKTEKDHGISPKTKKVKILDKTKIADMGDKIEKKEDSGGGDGNNEDQNKGNNRDKNRNRNRNKNKNKNSSDDSKIVDKINSSSGPSTIPIPIKNGEKESVALDRATASDRIKQLKLLALLKILKKFEVT